MPTRDPGSWGECFLHNAEDQQASEDPQVELITTSVGHAVAETSAYMYAADTHS